MLGGPTVQEGFLEVAPKPRFEREVSQLDVAQGCLISERYQGFILKKKRKIGSGANWSFTASPKNT